jgi:hypothetical protein
MQACSDPNCSVDMLRILETRYQFDPDGTGSDARRSGTSRGVATAAGRFRVGLHRDGSGRLAPLRLQSVGDTSASTSARTFKPLCYVTLMEEGGFVTHTHDEQGQINCLKDSEGNSALVMRIRTVDTHKLIGSVIFISFVFDLSLSVLRTNERWETR